MEQIEQAWRKSVRERVDSFKKEMGVRGQAMRYLSLLDKLMTLQTYRKDYKKLYNNSNIREKVVIGDSVKGITLEIEKVLSEMSKIENLLEGKEQVIKEEDIESARNVDVRVLFDAIRNDTVKCPFHDDHKPSASVKRGFFHCFVCGVSHDAIGICMSRDGMTFKQAVEYLKWK